MRRTARIAVICTMSATLLGGAGAHVAQAVPSAATDRPVSAAMASSKLPSKQAVANLFSGWNATLATGDPRKVADRYASDAVLLPTVSNKVRTNRAQIIDYFTKFLASKPQGVIKESFVNVLDRTTAIDTGVYVFTLTNDGKTHRVEARYTFVYELRHGRWLIVNHHSSAMPEPVSAS